MSARKQWLRLREHDCLEPLLYLFVALKKLLIPRASVHLTSEYGATDSGFTRDVAGFIISIMMVLTLCMSFCLVFDPSEMIFYPSMAALCSM